MPITAALTAPWAITSDGLQRLLLEKNRADAAGILFRADRPKIEALVRPGTDPLPGAMAATVARGVAVLQVRGTLFAEPSFLSQIMAFFGGGATTYADIKQDLLVALESSAVSAVLIDASTPGGDVDGVNEFAQMVFAARGRKPIWLYSGGMLCSAGYWFGAAADRIVCADTALVGSIGVRAGLYDDSEAAAKAGVRFIEIISEQSPNKRSTPVDDALVARYQATTNALAAVFVSSAAKSRSVTEAKVLADFGKGDVLVGKDAVRAGLVDELGNFDAVLAELAALGTRAPKSVTASASAIHTPSAAAAPIAPTASTKPLTGDRTMPNASADDDKKKCPDCDDGKTDDGSACKSCDGSGKVAKEAKAATKATKADDDMEPGATADDPDDDKPMDDKEAKAMQRVASLHGIKIRAGSSRNQAMAAIEAAAAARDTSSVSRLVDEKVQAALAVDRAKTAATEAKARAEQLTTDAIAGGYPVARKTALITFATSDYAAAKELVASHLKAADGLMQRSASRGSDRPSAGAPTGDVKVTKSHGRTIVRSGQLLSQKAKALAAKEKISLEAAMDRCVAESPELLEAASNPQ